MKRYIVFADEQYEGRGATSIRGITDTEEEARVLADEQLLVHASPHNGAWAEIYDMDTKTIEDFSLDRGDYAEAKKNADFIARCVTE